jgi:glycosyltransferase involved in cell wall biosynthesis
MKLAIITHVEHVIQDNCYYAYGPYVREMNVWIKEAEHLYIVAPLVDAEVSAIDLPYQHTGIAFEKVEQFSLISAKEVLKTLVKSPKIIWSIYKAMRQADHIHLRCPGNMGLLGAMVQMVFPKKPKTAKYAGNWDPKSKQPWSYRLQKGILSNTFLTRNMQVLVYGEWEGSSKNIKPFFTATYRESEKKEIISRTMTGTIRFLFVGTLSKGKRPLYAIQLVEQLRQAGYEVRLDLYGEGKKRQKMETYIEENKLQSSIVLQGNQTAETVQTAYEASHFLILPSKSEGWPKVVAEAMFWGCLPVASPVSCVSNMLDNGKRGLVLTMNLEEDVLRIKRVLDDEAVYQDKVANAAQWSRRYTLDYFEEEIKQLLKT